MNETKIYFYFCHFVFMENSPIRSITGNKSAEELTKRYILDAVLKSQCSPTENASNKSENDEDMESEDIVVSMTPPTSPKPPLPIHSSATISRHSNSIVATTSTLRNTSSAGAAVSSSVSSSIALAASASAPSSSSSSSNRPPNSQDAPIDLSMKSTCSGGSSAKSAESPLNHEQHYHDFAGSGDESTTALSEEEFSMDKQRPSSANSYDRPESRNDDKNAHIENPNGIQLKGTTPLDLTTKI